MISYFLKIAAFAVSASVAEILNIPMCKGFPQSIYKNSSKSNMNDYRLISVLSAPAQVRELLIYQQVSGK